MSLSPEEKRARFQKALFLAGNTHAVEDVAALVKSGLAQFWEYGDGFVVTEIHDAPRLKAIHYWLVSGDLRDCLALQREIDPWAIEEGCTRATAAGRRGWLRALEPDGWKPQPNWFGAYKTLVPRGDHEL
jgi:hypothetical protein